MKNLIRIRDTSLIVLSLLFISSTALAQTAQEDVEQPISKNDIIRTQGYSNFGPRYYQEAANYPYLAPNFKYEPLHQFAISLKSNAKPNQGADATNWVALPVKGKAVYYRAEYHLKDIQGIDVSRMYFEARDHYESNPKIKAAWDSSVADKNIMMKYGKIQMVVFPADQFRVKYYPGWSLLWRKDGVVRQEVDVLSTPRGGVRWTEELTKINPSEIPNLAAVLKGTYDNYDVITYRREGKLPGLIVDGKMVDQPSDYAQTVAVYRDGTFRIAPYAKLKQDLPKIQWLRQNELPLLTDGELDPMGTYPTNFARYADNIMRSYLFSSRDGKYIGYAFVNFAHPSFIAKFLQKIGFSEVMQLDIHPAIGAAVAMPSNDSNVLPFYQKGGAYPLIPLEQDVLTSAQQFVGVEAKQLFSQAKQSVSMQWPYHWTQTGAQNHDFFGVFVK